MNDVIYLNKDKEAKFGMILVHGRGADAADIMGLAESLNDNSFLYAAPDAPGNTWYPYSFLAPVEQNEPYLSRSLNIIGSLFREFNEAGISSDKIILAGFSQGACLSLEYVLRNPLSLGGIAAFSGGLISTKTNNSTNGILEDTPVFLGCSEKDPHIPLERVNLSAEIFSSLGADVTKKIYPGSFHGIVEDELLEFRKMIDLLKK